ncbi:MAG: hypothetical protein ACKVT2_22740 [Saprospiraceae bacterium]
MEEEDEISTLVKSILVNHFRVEPENFDWNKSLEELNKDLGVLGHLAYFEQLLQAGLNRKIPIIENISSNFHTPADVLHLVKKQGLPANELAR